MPILFAIVGPTGVGKSRFSISLCEKYKAQIIGVDSRQIYKGFCIGTAQPSKDILKKIPHHLVDFCAPNRIYSAGDFCTDVKKILKENPEKNFILVGGTGLYLQSLVLGLPQLSPIDKTIRQKLEDELSVLGLEKMVERAKNVDLEATFLSEKNPHRILRILEVFEGTGKKLSEWKKQRKGGIGEIPIYFLNQRRETLYRQINNRVDKMMECGWMEEVIHLSKEIPLEAPAWQSLGYKELLGVKSQSEIQSVLEMVKQKTRNYAKRQITWFSRQMKTILIDVEDNRAIENFIVEKK